MRRSKTNVYKLFSNRIILNKGTAIHHKGKEFYNVLLMSDYLSMYRNLPG